MKPIKVDGYLSSITAIGIGRHAGFRELLYYMYTSDSLSFTPATVARLLIA